MNDNDIVIQFWNRNEDAIAESKRAYGRYCLYIAENITGNAGDAEECLDDALLAAWNSIPPNRPENLKTYLGKLSRDAAISRRRYLTAEKRGGGMPCASLDEIEEIVAGSGPDEDFSEQELAAEISRYLRTLDKSKRNVFIRRYWYCDSVPSICSRYGFGKSKVLMMLKRTRDGLAEHLRKEGFIT